MKTKFAIHYFDGKRGQIARFSLEIDAREFGKFISRRYCVIVEMSDKTGLIGQWIDGTATPEFAHTEI